MARVRKSRRVLKRGRKEGREAARMPTYNSREFQMEYVSLRVESGFLRTVVWTCVLTMEQTQALVSVS